MTLSRRNVVIGGVAAVWIVLLVITFFIVRSSQESQRKAIQEANPTGTPLNREATQIEKENLLMNRSELEEAQRDYNTKTGRQSTVIQKKPKFNYQLAPSLKQATEPTPEALKRVLAAATTCNIDLAPDSVYVYDLKSKWTVEEAAILAKEYGIDSPSYSLPTETSSFTFQFTSKDNSGFFSLYESSGKYRYHKAGKTGAATLTEGQLRDRANAFITDHRLNSRIAPPVTEKMSANSLFVYKRILENFKLVDIESVSASVGNSVCDIPESISMGRMEVEVFPDGTITNLLNNTRTILGAYKAQRISLEEAVEEFGDAQPVDPIVVPSDAGIDAGTVTIESALLAYYDVGANFGQTLYTPMYITQGTVGSAQVIAFFPAVSANELVKKGLVKTVPKPGNAASQQQGTIPFATPTTFKPPLPPASFTGDNGMLGCPGGLVDYMVRCSKGGYPVCNGMMSVDSKTDPHNVCQSGCKDLSGTISYQAGTDPCQAFIDSQNLGTPAEPLRDSGFDEMLKPGDQLTCSINACPC